MIFGFDVRKIRKDFPVLEKGIIYFDNACMSLKPRQVAAKVQEYYDEYPTCAGRSGHFLSRRLEEEIAKARAEVRKFLGAREDKEIIFTRNTTESINLVANSLEWEKGDEIIVSDKEHNSNLIPWLKLKSQGVKVVVSKGNEDGTFNIENFKKCFSGRTKLVAVGHVSNLDGLENPIVEIARIAREKGVLVLIDGAQSAPHKEIDVVKMGVDFFAFSGHKALGPSGTGVLYGRRELLEKMNPFMVGGHTVIDSNYEGYTLSELPDKFEAGLADYAGIVGLGEACRYLRKVGMKNIEKQEEKLNKIITEGLSGEVDILGPADHALRGGIFSFNVRGLAAHDVARMLDSSKKIALRSGAFCVHSWLNARGLDGVVRASLYFYNTEEEARIFVEEVKKLVKFSK